MTPLKMTFLEAATHWRNPVTAPVYYHIFIEVSATRSLGDNKVCEVDILKYVK